MKPAEHPGNAASLNSGTPLAMKRPPSEPPLHWGDIFLPGRNLLRGALFDRSRVDLTYTGRGAIYRYVHHLRHRAPAGSPRNTVLVPAFHCPTVVDPILHAGYAVRFYAIDENLEVVSQDLLAKLDHHVAAVVFIRFFGFGVLSPDLAAACRNAGAKVIDDCSHSFLSANPLQLVDSGADATIFSFWKLIPTQVGGAVRVAAGEDLPRQATRSPPTEDRWRRLETITRQLFVKPIEALAPFRGRNGPGLPADATPPPPRLNADKAYPYVAAASNWAMPLSARLILTNSNLELTSLRRRQNFETLRIALQESPELRPIHTQLEPGAVPWGFPVILKLRGERDYLMRARGVPVFTFGEVLHPLLFSSHPGEKQMLDTATYLSDSLLALSIHQRLNTACIESYARIINDFTGGL